MVGGVADDGMSALKAGTPMQRCFRGVETSAIAVPSLLGGSASRPER